MIPKNWKTSLFGTLALACMSAATLFPEMKDALNKLGEGFLAIGLWMSRDHDRG